MRSGNLVSGPGFAFIINGGHSLIGGGDCQSWQASSDCRRCFLVQDRARDLVFEMPPEKGLMMVSQMQEFKRNFVSELGRSARFTTNMMVAIIFGTISPLMSFLAWALWLWKSLTESLQSWESSRVLTFAPTSKHVSSLIFCKHDSNLRSLLCPTHWRLWPWLSVASLWYYLLSYGAPACTIRSFRVIFDYSSAWKPNDRHTQVICIG